MKVIIDTNIIISAILKDRIPEQVIFIGYFGGIQGGCSSSKI
jgi:predicted nucleic acid-binding protein